MCTSVNAKCIVLLSVVYVCATGVVFGGTPCAVPDNGTGTITMPPQGCEYLPAYEPYKIINGLPPGTVIELYGPLYNFLCTNPGLCSIPLPPGECEMAGGTLGGHGDCFESTLELTVTGTGELAGFSRHLSIPVAGEIHTGPRNPGDPVQTFPTEMFRLQGELFGDPDFCTFRITAGTDFGLPCPGETTLTELPSGDFAVDSFFDITYQIEFEGCPTSQLDDMAGTTTATIRIETGFVECVPTPDGSACKSVPCPGGTDECKPAVVNYDPQTGIRTIIECKCQPTGGCYVDLAYGSTCVEPDNGTGTITMPARSSGCEWFSPEEVFLILIGLPPGATIEMDPLWYQFFCCDSQCASCSLSLGPVQCEAAGGLLGGQGHCFESTLDLTVTGTGDLAGFNRHLAVPMFTEVHTGPRNPGDPVQTFDTDVYRFDGQLFGDPDFCTFRITGGTVHSMPSPGETTLTQLPSGDFAVDSFFDISYQIEFEGCPDSQLADMAGITSATIRMESGETPGLPRCAGTCEECDYCREKITANPDGTIDVSCKCEPDADLNRDGFVDFNDFSIMADQWLTTRP